MCLICDWSKALNNKCLSSSRRQMLCSAGGFMATAVAAATVAAPSVGFSAIEVDKKADVIVLGADLFEVDPHDIHRVPVLLKLMDSKARHDKLPA